MPCTRGRKIEHILQSEKEKHSTFYKVKRKNRARRKEKKKDKNEKQRRKERKLRKKKES